MALPGYLAGAAPGLLWGDSAEMQILAVVGGVAHPTGYPLFTLVGRLFTAFGPGDLAWRSTLLSATFAAATLTLLLAFLLARGLRTLAALAGVAAWGLSFTFWATAQRSEVYSLATFMAVGALWCTVLALERGTRAPRLAAGTLLGLTLAGHMAFAPWVAVAGLVLAWNVPRAGVRWLGDELLLLLAFLVGLAPYAYLPWADHARHGLNYLQLVEVANWPASPVPEGFRTTLERFVWLLTGRNEMPPIPLSPNPRTLAKNGSDTFFLFALFELGPLAAVAAGFGLRAHWRASRVQVPLLFGMLAASVVFSAVTSGYKILSVFLIPCYLTMAVFVALGAESALARFGRTGTAWALVTMLLLVNAGLAHGARLYSYDHPIGPFRSKVQEEDDRVERSLLPDMSHETQARRFIESAAQVLPDNSLVITEWREYMALQYLQHVDRRRLDLVLQPSGYPTLLHKVAWWEQHHNLVMRPVVVIVGPMTPMAQHLVEADTLRLATGQLAVVTHVPLRYELPPLKVLAKRH
ncbi:MAG: DUF2723 domain-containing protein [Candidatus Eisenbacteria bacterium]